MVLVASALGHRVHNKTVMETGKTETQINDELSVEEQIEGIVAPIMVGGQIVTPMTREEVMQVIGDLDIWREGVARTKFNVGLVQLKPRCASPVAYERGPGIFSENSGT